MGGCFCSHQKINLNTVSHFTQCNENKTLISKISSNEILRKVKYQYQILVTYKTYKYLINQPVNKIQKRHHLMRVDAHLGIA